MPRDFYLRPKKQRLWNYKDRKGRETLPNPEIVNRIPSGLIWPTDYFYFFNFGFPCLKERQTNLLTTMWFTVVTAWPVSQFMHSQHLPGTWTRFTPCPSFYHKEMRRLWGRWFVHGNSKVCWMLFTSQMPDSSLRVLSASCMVLFSRRDSSQNQLQI